MISPSAHQLNCLFVCSMSTDVTSWRDGGGRAMAPTLSGEGAVDGGSGGGLVMDGAAGVPTPNSQSHGPPRIPPAGNPVLPLPQPPVGPGFPQYRGIMPPFVSTSLPYIFFCLQTNFIFYRVTGLNKASTALFFAVLQNFILTMNYVYFWRCFLLTCPSRVPMALRGRTGTQHPGKDHLLGRCSCQNTMFSGLYRTPEYKT